MINFFEGEYIFLSNFYIIKPGIQFKELGLCPTVEHAYQASKTLIEEEQMKILKASTPGEAKRLGRMVTLRKDWNKIKDDIMYNLCKEKFSLYPYNELLLATKDEELVEGNWWNDTYWGVCRGKGQNKLGKILMRIREELKSK